MLDLREIFVKLIEAWRASERPGENTLLPAALPPVLIATSSAAQEELLATARTLMLKVWEVGICAVHSFCWLTCLCSTGSRSCSRLHLLSGM